MSKNSDYWDGVSSDYNVFVKVPGEPDQLAYQDDRGFVFTTKKAGMGIAVFKVVSRRPNHKEI